VLVVSLISSWSVSVAQAGGYQVGVGDLLEINVLGEKEFSGRYRVESDGAIDFPYLYRISVAGQTIEELSSGLAKKLMDGYLTNPQVAVEIKEYRSQPILVLGAVKSPGTYYLREKTRILDLIAKAGGLAEAGGKRIVLLREKNPDSTSIDENSMNESLAKGKREPAVIDYYRLVHQGDFSQNVVLQAGDIVNVPKANEIFVLGNVGKPGPVKYEDKMTILEAVTLAGGPTSVASTKNTYIIRQGSAGEEKIKVRFDKILESKAKNVRLEPDDVIVIPESFF